MAFLVLMNSDSFYLSEKLFIFSSVVNDNLAGYSILGFKCLLFLLFKYTYHIFHPSRIILEKKSLIHPLSRINHLLNLLFPVVLLLQMFPTIWKKKYVTLTLRIISIVSKSRKDCGSQRVRE